MEMALRAVLSGYGFLLAAFALRTALDRYRRDTPTGYVSWPGFVAFALLCVGTGCSNLLHIDEPLWWGLILYVLGYLFGTWSVIQTTRIPAIEHVEEHLHRRER